MNPFLSKVLLAVAIIAGFTLVCMAAANLFWHATGHIALEIDDTAEYAESIGIASPINTAAIIAWAPFGTRTIQAVQIRTSATTSLVLHAVRLADPPVMSTATISIIGGDPRIYRIGDVIGDVARLKRVEAQQVILDSSGSESILSFPELRSKAPLTGIYAAKAAKFGGQPQAQPVRGTADEIINSFRSQIAANPKTVLDTYGLKPGANGYTVGENAPSVLLRAGLRPGDRVVKVNGESVGSVESDRQLFETVVASGRARVEILRDGRTITLSFPLR